MKIDANNFGDLIKLRFESRNNADDTNLVWFLRYLVLQKMNTEDEMRLYCNNWFGIPYSVHNLQIAKPQTFRELPVIRSNFLLGNN